jgi:hypothetical protein
LAKCQSASYIYLYKIIEMKKRYMALVAICFIALLAVFTNPKKDRHKEVLKAKLTAHLQRSADTNVEEASVGLGQAFGVMLGSFVVDQVVNNLVSTGDYILFSTTRITWDGETRTIGIGAFGNVYLSGKVDEALNSGLLDMK